jgi:hypothetical protein
MQDRKMGCCGGKNPVVNVVKQVTGVAVGYSRLLLDVVPIFAQQRFDVCLECPSARKTPNTNSLWCTSCGCYMNAKVRVGFMKCPEGKWLEYKEKQDGS